jgi:hypothetical protein
MRKRVIIVLLIAGLTLAVLSPGCSRVGSALNGSGEIIDQDIQIKDFNSLNVKGAFEIAITRAEDFQVTLSTDQNLISRVQFSLERKTLKIGIEAPASFFPTSLKVKIAMPAVSGLILSGGSIATIAGFKSTDDLTLFLGEGSILNGSLEAGVTRLYLSGASQAALKGQGMKLEMDAKGSSKADLGGYALTSAQVKLRETSEATLNVNGRFDVDLNNSSKIYYMGNPLFSNISISGGSTMVQK